MSCFFSSRFLFSAGGPEAITVASYCVSVALGVLIDPILPRTDHIRPEMSRGDQLWHKQPSHNVSASPFCAQESARKKTRLKRWISRIEKKRSYIINFPATWVLFKFHDFSFKNRRKSKEIEGNRRKPTEIK